LAICTHVLFWPFGFRGSKAKLCCLLPSCDMSYGPWWSQRWRMTWKPSFWGSAMVVWVFVTTRTCLVICDLKQQHRKVGAIAQVKFKSLPCRVKIQGLVLISCAWQWPRWRHCFLREDFFQGENLWSMIWYKQRLCTIFFLKASLLEKLYFWCCLGGVCSTTARNRSLQRNFFFHVILILFFGCVHP
jgi:hypothetical protein